MKNNAKFFHLREAIGFGKQIQELVGKPLADAFREGLSGTQLVEKFELTKKLETSKQLAKNGTLFALKGYDGLIRGTIGAYDGLIPIEEYKLLVKIHNEKSCEQVGYSNFKRKIGIHAQTDAERIEVIKAAIIACGGTPKENLQLLSTEHKAFLEQCTQEPEYYRGSRYNIVKIIESFEKAFPGTSFSRMSIWKIIGKKNQHKNAALIKK